jgi:hypothetical protein
VNRVWSEVVDRLFSEAGRRGGVAMLGDDEVTMQPPTKSGEIIRVTRYSDETGEDQHVAITTGFACLLAVSLNGENAPQSVLEVITAIMNGHASEVAEVAEDGTWLNTASLVQIENGNSMRSTQIAPSDHLKGIPVHHEHRRQIDPWPQPS